MLYITSMHLADEHGDVLFTSCPLTGGISVPLHTLCTSNLSLSSRNFVCVHWCEVASRFVFVRAWLKKDIPMLIYPALFLEVANNDLASVLVFSFTLI